MSDNLRALCAEHKKADGTVGFKMILSTRLFSTNNVAFFFSQVDVYFPIFGNI